MEELSDIFSPTIRSIQGVKAHIQLKRDAAPRFRKARPVALALKEKVKTSLEKMVQTGTLAPIRYSEWASPMVTVPKPGGELRLCANYISTLADQVDVEEYPLPHPDELFAKLASKKYYSRMDLRTCFEQFELDEDSKKILTVNIISGLMQY